MSFTIWITEINELFHDIAIYWDAPVLLFIKSRVYCPAHSIYYFFSYLYLCIFSCVCIPYSCSVHGGDLTYISLLVIICIIVYVTNKNLESFGCMLICYGYFTCQSDGLLDGHWPIIAVMELRPSAVSLKVWLCETTFTSLHLER